MLRLWQRWISWFDRDFWDQYEASARGLSHRSGEMILSTLLISVPDECVNVSELKMLICVMQAEFECINSKKKQKKSYKNSGVVCVKVCQVFYHINTPVWFHSQHLIQTLQCKRFWTWLYLMSQITKEYTFLDYIMGGCQINFTVSSTFSCKV